MTLQAKMRLHSIDVHILYFPVKQFHTAVVGKAQSLQSPAFLFHFRFVVWLTPCGDDHFPRHAGIDFAAAGGTPIYAAASGYVQVAGWSTGGYGNYVIIYHGKMSDGNTYSTLYAHMRSVATSAGKYVKQGELIGYVGTTGNSTGNHLHLEVWKGGSKANAVNPRSYIPIPHN